MVVKTSPTIKRHASRILNRVKTFKPTCKHPYPSKKYKNTKKTFGELYDVAAVIQNRKPAANIEIDSTKPIETHMIKLARQKKILVVKGKVEGKYTEYTLGKPKNVRKFQKYSGKGKFRKIGESLGYPKCAIDAFMIKSKKNFKKWDAQKLAKQKKIIPKKKKKVVKKRRRWSWF